MKYSLDVIHGLGPVHHTRLGRHNVRNTEDLLSVARDARRRRKLATEAGLSEERLREWANFADLLRVPGLGPRSAELLQQAGVEDLRALAKTRPERLEERLDRVSERLPQFRKPSHSKLRSWIDDARLLTGRQAVAPTPPPRG